LNSERIYRFLTHTNSSYSPRNRHHTHATAVC